MIPTVVRRAEKDGEERAAGLRRVVDRDRLTGEQERAVEVVVDEGLRGEALRDLGRLRGARLAALDEREDAAGDRRDAGGPRRPASSTRSRRFVRRARFTSCSDASRLAATNSRSSSFSSTAWSALQSSAAARRAPR